MDRRLLGRGERPRALKVEVALALDVVQLAEDVAVALVRHGEVVPALDRLGQAEMEVAEPDVPEDAADLVHKRDHAGGPLLA